MSCSLIVEQGNPPVLQVVLSNALTGLPINTAAVIATLKDAGGAEVPGETWPVTLTYITASAGVYRRQLGANVQLEIGQKYTVEFQATDASVPAPYTWQNDVYVVERSCGTPPPASSPASPAYTPPNQQALLNDAKKQYHELLVGRSARVVVNINGERVEYTAANRASLAQYISDLEATVSGAGNRGPMGVFF
jgi:hypothetical protein